jgi:NAD+ kinase
MILVDDRNPAARAAGEELRSRLSGVALDVVVVVGGDGFMLRAVHEHRGPGRVFLGVNAGRVGFLLNDVPGWDVVADRIRGGAWRVRAFPLLSVRVTDVTGAVWRELAVNDVYLERSTGQTAHFAVQIDGETFVDDLVADGVLLATALGSTAYTFSAGGPPCHPDLRALCITPICPHQPRLPAVVLPETARARVDVLKKDLRPARAVIDGRAIESVATVEAGFEDESVQLAFWSDVSLTSRLVRKILVPWP